MAFDRTSAYVWRLIPCHSFPSHTSATFSFQFLECAKFSPPSGSLNLFFAVLTLSPFHFSRGLFYILISILVSAYPRDLPDPLDYSRSPCPGSHPCNYYPKNHSLIQLSILITFLLHQLIVPWACQSDLSLLFQNLMQCLLLSFSKLLPPNTHTHKTIPLSSLNLLHDFFSHLNFYFFILPFVFS